MINIPIEYITCFILEGDHKKGDVFDDWPLHVTLVPWCLPNDLNQFIRSLSDITRQHREIHTVVRDTRIWGPHTVNVVRRTPKLHSLHADVLDVVRETGRLLINEEFTGEYYTPHVTRQGLHHVETGSSIQLSSISLVERDNQKKQKRIIVSFPLMTKDGSDTIY